MWQAHFFLDQTLATRTEWVARAENVRYVVAVRLKKLNRAGVRCGYKGTKIAWSQGAHEAG
jgi:hypothetical protein